jgi:organic hydroperoxide reductase OsmC/OhrA
MSEHRARVAWNRGTEPFQYETFSRDHSWQFGGGIEVMASSAPDFFGNPAHTNPEEALVAALAGCHMLTFLAIAAKKRLVVDSYADEPVGTLEKNAEGKVSITRVVLRPKVTFGGDRTPTPEECRGIHEKTHAHCFIANSVNFPVGMESDCLSCTDLAAPESVGA